MGQGKKCTALGVGRVKLFTYHHKHRMIIVESVFLIIYLIFHINSTLYDDRNLHIICFVSIYVQS